MRCSPQSRTVPATCGKCGSRREAPTRPGPKWPGWLARRKWYSVRMEKAQFMMIVGLLHFIVAALYAHDERLKFASQLFLATGAVFYLGAVMEILFGIS